MKFLLSLIISLPSMALFGADPVSVRTTNGVSYFQRLYNGTNYGSTGNTNFTYTDNTGWHNTNTSATLQGVDISKGNIVAGGFIGVGTNQAPLYPLTLDNTKSAGGFRSFLSADQSTTNWSYFGITLAGTRVEIGSVATGAGTMMDLDFVSALAGTFNFGRNASNPILEIDVAATRATAGVPLIKFRPTGNDTAQGFTAAFELAGTYAPAAGANNEGVGVITSPALNSTAAATTSQYFASRISPHFAGTTGFTNLVIWDVGTNSTFEGIGTHTSFAYITTNGILVLLKGLASYATDAAVSIAATGWTNTFGKNATVYLDGTAVTFTVKNGAGTPVYTNAVSLTGEATVNLQPGGAVTITGTGVTGRATPL